MTLDATIFTKSLGSEPPPKIVLFAPGKPPFGKEDFDAYLVDEAVEALINKYVDPTMRDLTYSSLYAEETAPGAIAEEANTLPFLAERRVILVRNAEKYMLMSGDKKSPLAPLLACIENPSETTLLMFIASSADKRTRFYKACAANGVIVECAQLDDHALGLRIKASVKARERSITQEGIHTLLECAGSKLHDIMNAVNLVCNYVDAGAVIDATHVRAACADVAETTVWALTDAIAASNSTAALEALHELLAMHKAPDEIMGTINWLLESAYRAMPETQATLKSNFVAKKVAPLGRKFGLPKLIAALALCTRTHFSLRTTGADATLMLEMLIIKLSAGGRKTRQRATR